MFLSQMNLVEQAEFLSQNPEVRILVVPKDKDFRHDINEPLADYEVNFDEWEKEFKFQMLRHRNKKENIICLAVLRGNGEFLAYEKIKGKEK